MTMLSIELSTTAVAALGILLIILLGHTDLSVGSAIGFTGGIATTLVFNHQWPAPAAMGVSFVAGVAVYSAMGLIVAKERIPAFIITLGGLLIFKGFFWKVIGNQTMPVKAGDTENMLSVLTTWYLPLWASIAACVIGGTSLTGGRGTVPGVLAGAFLIATLMNGMTLMAVSPEMKFIARGTVLALAVWIDVRLSRRGG